jgi:hypothetical protein
MKLYFAAAHVAALVATATASVTGLQEVRLAGAICYLYSPVPHFHLCSLLTTSCMFSLRPVLALLTLLRTI